MTPPALRHCLRTSPSRILRCQSSANAQLKCLALAICPARRSLTSKTLPQVEDVRRIQSSNAQQRIKSLKATGAGREAIARGYSTKEGTIGSGEEGVGGSKMEEAPEHLNAKEKEIWGLLMRELGASELKVRPLPVPFLLYPIYCVRSWGGEVGLMIGAVVVDMMANESYR
jgi:hypothetical protein